VSNSERDIPAVSGSYLLILYLPRRTSIQVGRLGCFSFPRGWYCYAGSAFGPGGLRARLQHHLKPLQRFHWHIDYLRQAAQLRTICYQCGVNNEHRWAAALAELPRAGLLSAGFGSSDCSCYSHLVYLPRRSGRRQLREQLGGRKLKFVSISAG